MLQKILFQCLTLSDSNPCQIQASVSYFKKCKVKKTTYKLHNDAPCQLILQQRKSPFHRDLEKFKKNIVNLFRVQLKLTNIGGNMGIQMLPKPLSLLFCIKNRKVTTRSLTINIRGILNLGCLLSWKIYICKYEIHQKN